MRQRLSFAACILLLISGLSVNANPPAPKRSLTTTIRVHLDKPVNSFRPNEAIGAGVDGMERGDIAKVYTAHNLKAMLSAGFKPLSYRLRTELGVEAWHWNPRGRWSDSKNSQGYWTSEATPGGEISFSNGYALPRRGSSSDQANNRGFSRLCDGDLASFWKSNPYLDKHFTGEENSLHPQWVLIDFYKHVSIDTAKIEWGTPYATKFKIEYWQGDDPKEPDDIPEGKWIVFKNGEVSDFKGGVFKRKISPAPIKTRLLRITMTEASGKSSDVSDIRNGLGFAICEISMGVVSPGGKFQDCIRHARNATDQTHIVVSSTDPWSSSKDLDRNVEQPGFDRVFKSGLTNRLPVLIPVGMLYDTPENAANEIRWLKSRRYPVSQIELGEEPDGQYISPEDYGALYVQWADAIHQVDPTLKFGGPGFQTSILGWETWPDEQGYSGWMFRFLRYLNSRNHLQDFNFFTFEWYPFDDVTEDPAKNLQRNPKLLADLFVKLKEEGVPATIPWIISEYGYSAFSGQPEVELPGAILNLDIVAQFLTLGGNATYLYGYEPNRLIQENDDEKSWGNLMLLMQNGKGKKKQLIPLPSYYAARLLNFEWLLPGVGKHELYRVESGLKSKSGDEIVSAYAVRRPDGSLALMLLNKSPSANVRTSIQIAMGGGDSQFVASSMAQYSPEQYRWKPNGSKGRPVLNKPPIHRKLKKDEALVLPPYSITILK